MSDLIIKAVEDGIKSVETKLGAQLQSAMEKYEGQVALNGKAQEEILLKLSNYRLSLNQP